MLFVWTLLPILALLAGHGEAQSCKAWSGFYGRNVARGRPAIQSSLYNHEIVGYAGKAVDGKCLGNYLEFGSCTHTNYEMNPWWQVDLGDQYSITAVAVKNREDCCCKRLQGAQVLVGHDRAEEGTHSPICGTITDSSPGSISTFMCNGLNGRYVTIVIPGRKEYLTLCEVEVYGTKLSG